MPGAGDDTLTGGPGRDVFAYYARDYDKVVDNGRDTITDFDGTGGDTVLLSGFARAEVEVRTEGGDTVVDLPGPAPPPPTTTRWTRSPTGARSATCGCPAQTDWPPLCPRGPEQRQV